MQGVDVSALGPGELRRLHRQASAEFLRDRNPGIISTLDDPLLPLFMAEQSTFDRLLRYCGLLVLGLAIRRVIVRDEVQALQAELEPLELVFARKVAPGLWIGGAPPRCEAPLAFTELGGQVAAAGAGLLFLAAQAASAPVAQRALLRLPGHAKDDVLGLPESLADRQVAAKLALSVLEYLDAPWLSAFPRRH